MAGNVDPIIPLVLMVRGLLELEFLREYGRPKEMEPWIRSWGSEAEGISPPALRQAIAREATKMAANYQGLS